jgi:hypothetical protein
MCDPVACPQAGAGQKIAIATHTSSIKKTILPSRCQLLLRFSTLSMLVLGCWTAVQLMMAEFNMGIFSRSNTRIHG